MDRIDLRNRIGCVDALVSEPHGDNLGVALATYFSDHPDRPEGDPTDADTGWGVWVLEKSNDLLDRIAAEAVSLVTKKETP